MTKSSPPMTPSSEEAVAVAKLDVTPTEIKLRKKEPDFAAGPKIVKQAFRGPFGYDPMSEWFWRVLICMMLLGVFVHMKRVINGYEMWSSCTTPNQYLFKGRPFALWNHCFWDKTGGDGFWRITHFIGGIFWMLCAVFQVLTWNTARYHPTMIKVHRITGKIWWVNALTLVIGVGTAPSVRDWIVNPTPHCTLIAIVGGVPANLALIATRDYVGCPTYLFLPHFLTWAFTSAGAVIMTIYYSAKDKSRRVEHQSWGLTFAALGCFDSINYTIKHVLLSLGWSAVDIAHYFLWWTPMVFCLYLFWKTKLGECHAWPDLIKFMLFGWPQILIMIGIHRIPMRPDFQERLKKSEMDPSQYDDLRAEYANKGLDKATSKRILYAFVVFVPIAFAFYVNYGQSGGGFVSEEYFKSH